MKTERALQGVDERYLHVGEWRGGAGNGHKTHQNEEYA